MSITTILLKIFAFMPIAHPENKADYYNSLAKPHRAYNEYAYNEYNDEKKQAELFERDI